MAHMSAQKSRFLALCLNGKFAFGEKETCASIGLRMKKDNPELLQVFYDKFGYTEEALRRGDMNDAADWVYDRG